MVDEVVTGERVHQVTVAGQMRRGDRDDLTLARRLSQLSSTGKQLGYTPGLISAAATTTIGSWQVSARHPISTAAAA